MHVWNNSIRKLVMNRTQWQRKRPMFSRLLVLMPDFPIKTKPSIGTLPTTLQIAFIVTDQDSAVSFDSSAGWQNFVDFHKCVNAKGEEFAPCKQFKKAYHSLCPNEWITTWEEQIDNGTFPASLKP
ncbi:hypothetical protein L204_103147 [Cryptococcus depauperatus]